MFHCSGAKCGKMVALRGSGLWGFHRKNHVGETRRKKFLNQALGEGDVGGRGKVEMCGRNVESERWKWVGGDEPGGQKAQVDMI